MGLKSKIYVSYKLDDPPELVKPNDEIKGKLILRSEEKKEKKIKRLEVNVIEEYLEKVIRVDQESGEETKSYEERKNKLMEIEVAKGEKIGNGDTKEWDFKIKLPGSWTHKKKSKIKNWHLSLWFIQKTGMVESRGADKDAATCVLPVEHSKMSPSFGKLPPKVHKEKKDKDKDKKKKQ